VETPCPGAGEARFLPFRTLSGSVRAVLAWTVRLDMQEAARFLSYLGILLESWRWKHWLHGATSEIGGQIGIPGEGRVEQEADGSWVTGRRASAERGIS
jgi:hypothetical protein